MKSPNNETNTSLMGNQPTNKLSFDVYRAELNKGNTSYSLEFSNVISWDSFIINMTNEELKVLADFINRYLEND